VTDIPHEALQAASEAVRRGLLIHLQPNTLASASAGQPVRLSGGEADEAARLALDAALPYLAPQPNPIDDKETDRG
jgi:hypothetical protein